MYGGNTGYTYPISEGKITTGAEFLKRCIRAFGACGVFREEPLDIPLEKLMDEYLVNKPKDSYYKSSCMKAKEEYADFLKKSEDEKLEAFKGYLESEIANKEKNLEKTKKDYEAYNKIRNEVMVWQPPTDQYESIKAFAVEQLDMCRPTTNDILETQSELEILQTRMEHFEDEFEEWKKMKIEKYEDVIKYYESHGADETDRNEDNLQYLNVFLESLK